LIVIATSRFPACTVAVLGSYGENLQNVSLAE
jgi:hypothetical protein